MEKAKAKATVGVFVAWLLVASACNKTTTPGEQEPAAIPKTVATAAYPAAWLVQAVGGEHVRTLPLLSTSSDLHDAELAPSAVEKLGTADLVVLLSRDLQPGVDEALAVRGVPEQRILRLGDALQDNGVLGLQKPSTSTASELAHFWLDPVGMDAAVDLIEQALVGISPEAAQYFQQRSESVHSALRSLHEDYRRTLESCRSRILVVYHSAYGSMAKRYGLQEVAVVAADPEAEPKPSQIRTAIEAAKSSGVKAIFSDSESGTEAMEQVAKEARTSLEILDPIETENPPDDYTSRMRSNLEKISNALECNNPASAK